MSCSSQFRLGGVQVQSQAQIKDRIDVVVPAIEEVLREADPALVEEFGRVALAGADGRSRMTVEADLTGIADWLQGRIDAAAFEPRFHAEATAYAQAGVKGRASSRLRSSQGWVVRGGTRSGSASPTTDKKSTVRKAPSSLARHADRCALTALARSRLVGALPRPGLERTATRPSSR
jgi:hypothetical protein